MALQLAVDPDTGEWRMPYDDAEPVYKARLEKAKSGRAKCRMCGDAIQTGSWRIGVPIKWRAFISVWHHTKCFFFKEGPLDVENGEVYGWDAVEDPNEMIELAKELRRTEAPAHIGGEIDVEDEKFLSGGSMSAKKKLKTAPPRLPAPESMTIKLLPFQEEGHAWMLDRERNSPEQGGILADEMGLGKTIQTISLLVSGKKDVGKGGGPTLIIAPSSAMLQWQDEITRCTKEGTLSVLVYQSTKRKKLTPADIISVDVVLTSYPILENEYRQAINAQKVDCVYCGRKFLKRKLIPHHKYFCGPEAQKTARLQKQEKTREQSTKKAMVTLRIGTAPTPTAIYRELMVEAGRTPSSMMTSADEARARDRTQRTTPSRQAETPSEPKRVSSTPKITPTTSKKPTGSNLNRNGTVKVQNSVQEREVDRDARTVTFSKDSPKVAFLPDDTPSRQRNSALQARQKLTVLGKDETSDDEYGGGKIVWYVKDIGLFWRGEGLRWRAVDEDFEQLTPESAFGKIVIKSKDVLIRLGIHSLETSLDGGETWVTQLDDPSSECWVSTDLVDEEDDDSLRTSGPYVGASVVRSFEDKDIVGVVFAYLAPTPKGDPPLWRVRHVDGDVEDLDEDELKNAIKRASKVKKLNLAWLRPFLKERRVKVSSRPREKNKKTVVNVVSDDEDDDDAFEAESSETSTSSSGSEDLVDEDSESDVEVIDEDENEDDVRYVRTTTSTTTPASTNVLEGPRFVPQTWGPDEAPEEWQLRMDRVLKRDEKAKVDNKKKNAAKRKAKMSDLKKTKGKSRDSSSSSSSSWSESDSDEDDGPLGDIVFAPEGEVVDDDGIDLNRSLLHCIAWHRIILDEAHKIKERTNSTAKSVFALRGEPASEGPPFPSNEVLGHGADVTETSLPTLKSNGKKDPNAPKKPKSAYQCFCDTTRLTLKEANDNLPAKEITKMLSNQWKDMTSEKKAKFVSLAEDDKQRFIKEMETYSPPPCSSSEESESSSEEEMSEEEVIRKTKRTKIDAKRKSSAPVNGRKTTVSSAIADEEGDGSAAKPTSTAKARGKRNKLESDSDEDDEQQSEGSISAKKRKGKDSRANGKNRNAKHTDEIEEKEETEVASKKAHGHQAVLFDKCRRWALTGTPLMNRLGDLYSLVRFIRVSPYSYYFCKKGCKCRLLQWSFGWEARFCVHCGHTPMSHYSFFNKTIMNPVNRNGYVGAGRRAMLLLRDELLGQVMLRRTKVERKDDLNLPPLTVETTEIELTPEERDFYESIYKLTQSRFDTFVSKGTIMNNYAHVFQLLSRLRQAADHPYLIVASSDNLPSKASGASDICRICMMNVDDVGNLAVAKCRHTFHRECVEKYIEDFEEGLAAAHEEVVSGKKKGTKAKGKKHVKGDGDDELDVAPKQLPKCPSCHVPLTVTLKVHSDDHHPHHDHHGENGEQSAVPATNAEEDSSCVICFDRPRTALLMPCGHAYMCYECASGLENKTCPVCRTKIVKIVRTEQAGEEGETYSKKKKNPLFGRKSILQKLRLEEFASSSKLDAIVKEIRKATDSANRATEKIIVFSQFTTFLDIIQWRLESLKISGVVKLVGSLSVEERRAVLKAFKTDPKINVILMSLKAGGEGLNLQEATVVLSCDPWWNPSVELQAFHRAHRIGQTRAVRAVRFVTRNTIEERMVELQQKKSLIFDGTVDGNETSLNKLTQDDLRFLFQR